MYRGTVKVAVNGEQRCIGVTVSFPDGIIALAQIVMGHIIILPGLIISVDSLVILIADKVAYWKFAALFNGHNQVILLQFKKTRELDTQVMIRILKHNPEVVMDNIQSNLATADRPPDKGHNHIVNIIEKELVAGTCGDLLKGTKWIGALHRIIAHQMRLLQPVRLDK